ncbi:MAG: hypothetical protein ABEI57_03865 [Halapricum sp.]
MTEQSTATLLESTTTYAGDLEGHLDDLVERLDGTEEGLAVFAREHLRHAISDLEEIDLEEGSE